MSNPASKAAPDAPVNPTGNSLAAVERLFHAGALAEAEAAARTLAAALPAVPLEARIDLDLCRSRIARRRQQRDHALRHALAALALAQQCGDRLREAAARTQHAYVLDSLGLGDEALAECYAALNLAQDADAARADALGALANAQWTLAAWDDARQTYERMQASALAAGAALLHAHAEGGLGGIEHLLGDAALDEGRPDEARLHFERAAEHAVRYGTQSRLIGSVFGDINGSHNHAIALLGLGDLAGARRELEQVLARLPPGHELERAMTLKNLGDVDFAEGKTASARAHAAEALAAFEQLDRPDSAMVCCEALCNISEAEGDLKQALAWHRRFHRLFARAASASARAHASAMAVKYETDTAKALARFESERADQLAISHGHLSLEAERLSLVSRQDGLTGLANRRSFDEALQAVAGADRTLRRCALAMLDLDHFKQINDAFSHPLGDHVLRRLATLLTRSARPFDLIARYGGEEFAIIFRAVDVDEARAVCERIRAAVERAEWSDLDPRLQVSVSIGLAHIDEVVGLGEEAGEPAGVVRGPTGGVAERLVSLADRRLYRAKSGGRNRVVGP